MNTGSNNSSITSLPGSQTGSQTSTVQATLSSGQQATPASTQSTAKTKKKERTFKLTLLSVNEDVIECSFDTYKNYRINFKFDINEDESIDISKSMVR